METIAIEDMPSRQQGATTIFPIAELVSLPVGRAVDFGAEWPEIMDGRKPNAVAGNLRNALRRHSGMMATMRQGHVYVARTAEDN